MNKKSGNKKAEGTRGKYRNKKKERDLDNQKERGNFKATKDDLGNEIGWHVADAQVLSDIASLPFSNVLQDDVKVLTTDPSDMSVSTLSVRTPGIITLWAQNAYGFGSQQSGTAPLELRSDPLNIAAKSLYSFVRKHNSGSANYDEVDLMQYIISMDSVYTFWAWLTRLYGTLRVYNYKNRYAPEALLGAMGISDTDDQKYLYSNMSRFRFIINNMALRMSSLAVPTVMPLLKRHVWMYSNIFLDADDPKAQMYVFNPVSFSLYLEAQGQVKNEPILQYLNDATLGSILDRFNIIIDAMLSVLLSSQSIGIMSGDILKAYEGNIYTFGTIGDDFTVLPVYTEKVLPMIHNARTSGLIIDEINQDVNNHVLYQHIVTSNTAPWSMTLRNVSGTAFLCQNSERFLNVPYQNPTPEDVLYATRFMSLVETNPADNSFKLITGCDNIVAMSMTADSRDGKPITTPILLDWISTTDERSTNGVSWETIYRKANLMAQFDWAPYADVMIYGGSPERLIERGFNGDLANYTVVNTETIAKLHYGDFCGLYGIPYTLTRA